MVLHWDLHIYNSVSQLYFIAIKEPLPPSQTTPGEEEELANLFLDSTQSIQSFNSLPLHRVWSPEVESRDFKTSLRGFEDPAELASSSPGRPCSPLSCYLYINLSNMNCLLWQNVPELRGKKKPLLPIFTNLESEIATQRNRTFDFQHY